MSGLEKSRPKPVNNDGATAALRENLSAADFAAVIAALGGREVKFPSPARLHDGHMLVEKLGRDLAATLCDLFCHELVSIPVSGRRSVDRDAVIVQMLDKGATRGDIAAHLGVSQRHVRRMIARIGYGDRQATVSCANSNVVLTGRVIVSGSEVRPANQNRVSGL